MYAHSPLVALQLGSLDNIAEAENVQKQVLWIHALQPRIAEIGKSRGAFLVHPQEQGTRYLFIVNPELSTRAQVSNVLNLAADLRQLMSTVSTQPLGTAGLVACPRQTPLPEHTLTSSVSLSHQQIPLHRSEQPNDSYQATKLTPATRCQPPTAICPCCR